MIVSHDTLEVQKIEMEEKKKEKLIEKLCERIERTLKDRQPLEDDWEIGVQQYHSALKRKDGEEEDSQLDLPTTRQVIEMAIARFMNPIFQRDKIMICKPTEDQYVEFSKALEDFINHIVDRSKFRQFLEMFLKQVFVYPKGVVKIPFAYKTKKVKHFYYMSEDQSGQMEEHWGVEDKNNAEDFQVKSDLIPVGAGVELETVPTPDLIHPIPISNLDSSPWLTHRLYRTKDELQQMIDRSVYDELQADGKKTLEQLGDPEAKPNAKLYLSETLRKKGNSDSGDSGELFEIWEIYTTLEGEEVIITVERKSRTVLRFVENFYHDDQRPFKKWSYEEVLNDVDGISLCYILEPYHRALSACLNQRLDAASRSMEQILLYSQTLGLGRYVKDGKLRSGAYAVDAVTDISKHVAQFQVSQPFSQMQTLEQDIKRDVQKLVGFNDYNAGVEQVERPTATGQIALIEEGRQPQYNRMESLRRFLSDVVMCMVSRYVQFYPGGFEYYLQSRDPEEQQILLQLIEWPTEYWRNQVAVETSVSSQTMNKDLRKQELLALVDKMPQVFEPLLGYAEAATSPSPIAATAAVAMKFYNDQVIQPWLEAFDVVGREALNFDDSVQMGQSYAQAVAQMEQQINQMGGALEQSGNKIEQLQKAYTDLARTYVVKTNEQPPPPPQGELPSNQQAQANAGMGGGPAVS